MADNLNFPISADTTKLKGDIDVAKSLLRDLAKEVRLAADEFRKTGDRTHLDAVERQIRGVEQSLAGMNRQLRVTSQGMASTGAEAHGAARYVRELVVEMGHFAHVSGISIEGIKALRYGFTGFIAAEFIRGIKSAIDELNKLNSAAKGIRADPKELKALETSFKQAGQDASLASTMLGTFNKQWDQLALKQKEGRGGVSGVNVLTGGMQQNWGNLIEYMTVARGGQRADLEEALKRDPIEFILGRQVNIKQQAQDFQEVAKRILAVKDATVQNTLAEKAYGLTIEQVRPQLEQIAKGTLPAEPGPAMAAEAQQKALDTYNKTTTGISNQWQKINQDLGIIVVNAGEAATHLENWIKILRSYGEILAPEGAPSPPSPAPPPPAPAAPYTGDFPPPPPPMASGGFVRGPGSGTSDSILARLSNGEFVMNASSVRRIGVGFLRSLNSFADGGFVGVPPIPFANGGLVAAASSAGSTAVHLHLGGREFALSGRSNVVSELVVDASRAQMRSAGTKPSWYAGRPTG